MNYKELERKANLGDYTALQTLKERQNNLENLPIRDAMGYPLTWCPSSIPENLLTDIDCMYQNISITNIDTDILIEEESFHSCRIEGADTTIDELFDIFRAKRTETKGEKMILNTYRAVKYLNITRKRDVNTLVKLWKIVTKDICDNPTYLEKNFEMV